MGDGAEAVETGWRQGFNELQETHKGLLDGLDYDEGVQLGRDAALTAIAPVLWRAQIGERWGTAQVTGFLQITRQAVYKKVRARGLLGIPGRGTTWFPAWQFDPSSHQVRLVVSLLLAEFHKADDQLSPLTIASWATTEQPELLDTTPATWISAGKDPAQVVQAARQTAANLAR
jgi:hypothetical protein